MFFKDLLGIVIKWLFAVILSIISLLLFVGLIFYIAALFRIF